jgi:hypothetical protein
MPDSGDDDLPGLARRAGTQLSATARAADERIDEVDRAASKRSVRVLMLTLTAVIVVLVASVVLNLYTLQSAQETSRRTGALQAGDAASAEVTSARSSSLLVVRRDFAAVNAAMVRAGLSPCDDPGPQASAYQLSWVTGECAGTLRTIGELQKRGSVQLPGVSAPDPGSAAFPSAAH